MNRERQTPPEQANDEIRKWEVRAARILGLNPNHPAYTELQGIFSHRNFTPEVGAAALQELIKDRHNPSPFAAAHNLKQKYRYGK